MIYTRLLACCSQIWDAVRNILCFDALEGREKQDGNDDDEDDDVAADKGSRDILSFCWRALKESRLVFISAKPQCELIVLMPSSTAFLCMLWSIRSYLGDMGFLRI